MNPTLVALLALVAGAAIGTAITLTIVAALRARARGYEATSAEVPEGVQDVLHSMDDPAIVVDTSGIVLAASVVAASFSLAEGEVLGDDALRLLSRRARTSATGVASETLVLHRGVLQAEPRTVDVRATRISPRLTLMVLRDVTEKERLEQMRRDFVANTSHELKTPVGAVTLLAEAVESAADDPEQVRIFAGRLIAEAARLAQLTTRIMSLSRLQSADDLTADREVSIDAVVASAVDAHAVQAAAADVEIKRGGERGLYVRGDAQVLSEALGNLVTNAIAYSPAGSKVGVGVGAADGVVEITVADRGIGISETDQERIFERFYRADQARSRRTGGTGLGLSIVKHAVQRHGGEVKLWSRPGRGSTFTVRLPQVPAPDDAVLDSSRKSSPRKKKKKKTASKGLPS